MPLPVIALRPVRCRLLLDLRPGAVVAGANGPARIYRWNGEVEASGEITVQVRSRLSLELSAPVFRGRLTENEPGMIELQKGFSDSHPTAVFDVDSRQQKARKVLAVLEDYLGDLGKLSILEVGCAAGVGTKVYGARAASVVGIDIDGPAVLFARARNRADNIVYCVMDSQAMGFPDAAFDVVICAHVYEHVPDARRLIGELHRVLKKGGVCFFAAGNKWRVIEPHYRLPFLSMVPKPLAHRYLRIAGRGDCYYENHLSYWRLRELVSPFEIIDYTKRTIDFPSAFCATDMLREGSVKHRLSQFLIRVAYWACPTFLWLLRK